MSSDVEDGWTSQLFAELVPWLEQAHPAEGCGLIVEDTSGRWRFEPCDNVIDRYHELDPQEYPRTSREFYMIDPRKFMEIEASDEEVAVIVHSHPDTGDYFSDEDVAAALMPRDTEDDPVEPLHPGTDYLVVSVRDARAVSATLYRFSEEGGPFVEAASFDEERLQGSLR